MLHMVSTLGFLGVALAAAALVWTMLADHADAIAVALGIDRRAYARHATARRVRVRAVTPGLVRTSARAEASARRSAA